MTTDKLNDYIKHYIEKDMMQGALMLTAPWGSGKSYYINNTLIPYLNKQGKKVILVSLYGLKTISEINKSLFLECKLKIANKNSTKINAGKIFAKTIVKGVASYFGVDLNLKEEDLEKLYSSVDLTNKLIIFEDVERSQIDILEFLGFVNNLVEQDSIKVLLVTNEEEIFGCKQRKTKHDEENQENDLNEKSQRYLRVKEKTVSDTIQFHISYEEAVKDILSKFNDKNLESLIEDSIIKEILEIMFKLQNYNLRSFIFACQKTSDIFDQLNDEYDKGFYKSVFLGNLAFCLRQKEKGRIIWDNQETISYDLGTYKYPLYRFSYDYICHQFLDNITLKEANQKFIQLTNRETTKNEIKPYLHIIYSYYISKESDIIKSVNFILNKLETTNDIPYEEYGKLSNYLIAIKHDLGCHEQVNKCKSLMLSKIKDVSSETVDKIFFYSGIQLESEEAKNELNSFKNDLRTYIGNSKINEFDFDYNKDCIETFESYVYKNKEAFIDKRSFARKIDNNKLVLLVSKCDPKEIEELRGTYLSVYSFSNIKDYFSDDLDSILDLKVRLEKVLSENKITDKICIKQIKYFIENLSEIESKLK